MNDEQSVSVTINGRRYEQTVPIRMLLVDLLRDVLGLTGTHVACSYEGRCGACTVIVDGNAVKSCMMLASILVRRPPIVRFALPNSNLLRVALREKYNFG